MACRKMFVALDHSLRHMRIGQEIVVKDDGNLPLDMWNFLRKYRPMRFRVSRKEGVYKIKRRLNYDPE